MAAKPKKYWITERHNPQLGVYYIAEGQMSGAAAKRKSNPIYGSNIVHGFETEVAYNARLKQLRKQGETVQ